MICARCGTQNPEGNRFCMSCGTPLAPAASPQPAYAAPPGYQSPYYAPPPATGAPVVHRTPWVLIVSIVLVLVLVAGAAGTVLALTAGRHNTQDTSGFSDLSSPSPLATPSPGVTLQPSPSPSSQPSSVANDSETVAVPDGWQVLNKDANSVSLQSPSGDGALTVGSGSQSPPASAQQLKDSITKQLTLHYTDAAPCPGSKTTNGPIAGVNGIFWTECFTLTSGGQTEAVAEPIWVGANANGSVAYVVVLLTTQDNLSAFVKECSPILKSGISWKLK